MKVKPIEEIRAVAEQVAKEAGVEVFDVEFKMAATPSLTVFIDRDGGVDLNTCEKYHRAFDVAIDELDPTFGEPYILNVSSPGLDRPIVSERDFRRCLGKEVEVKLYAPQRGKKYYEGVLVDFDENTFTVDLGGEKVRFEKSRAAKVNLAIKID